MLTEIKKIVAKNRNFGQKSKFWPKIEKFPAKSKFWLTIKNLDPSEKFVLKNRNLVCDTISYAQKKIPPILA